MERVGVVEAAIACVLDATLGVVGQASRECPKHSRIQICCFWKFCPSKAWSDVKYLYRCNEAI